MKTQPFQLIEIPPNFLLAAFSLGLALDIGGTDHTRVTQFLAARIGGDEDLWRWAFVALLLGAGFALATWTKISEAGWFTLVGLPVTAFVVGAIAVQLISGGRMGGEWVVSAGALMYLTRDFHRFAADKTGAALAVKQAAEIAALKEALSKAEANVRG